MKNLSKTLFICLLTFISVQTFAQKFGVQAGVNLANMLVKDDDDTYSDDFKMNLGLNAGVTFEMGFGDLLALEVGLLADSKGYKYEESGYKEKYNLLYADIPVLLKVGPSLGPVKIFGAAGPYVGIGLTGNGITEYGGEKETTAIKWGSSDEDDAKRLDYGAKFGAGAEIAGLNFGIYYSLGLANISAYTDNGSKVGHKVLSFSVGYKFGK